MYVQSFKFCIPLTFVDFYFCILIHIMLLLLYVFGSLDIFVSTCLFPEEEKKLAMLMMCLYIVYVCFAAVLCSRRSFR